MNLQNVLDVFMFLWNTGLLTVLTYLGSHFIIAHTKNKNLLLLNEWALQAVEYAEHNQVDSAEKKHEAMSFLVDRLNKNKLGVKFSEKQLDTVIELAVHKLKGGK